MNAVIDDVVNLVTPLLATVMDYIIIISIAVIAKLSNCVCPITHVNHLKLNSYSIQKIG